MSEHFNATCVSVGDLLNKEAVKRTEIGQEIDYYIKNGLYVPDGIVTDILAKSLQTQKDNAQCFVEGFPKTIYQAKYLVSKGIVPDAIIFVNSEERVDKINLRDKFEGLQIGNDIEEDSRNYYEIYKFNIQQCKSVFRTISLEFDNSQDNTLERMAQLIKYKLKKGFDSPLRFVLLGESNDQRNLLLDKFVESFGVKPISIDKLISTEIKSKSEIAHKLLHHLENKQQIPNQLKLDLIMQRTEMTDAQINGFVIDLTGQDIELINQIYNRKLSLNFSALFTSKNKPLTQLDQLQKLAQDTPVYTLIDSETDVNNIINKIIFEITHI